MRKMLRFTCMAALSLVLWACAGGQATSKTPQPPKPPSDPWSWVPPDGTFIGRVSLQDLRNTELWPLWAEIEKEQNIDTWVALEKVARATFGGSGQSAENVSYVAALEGDYGLLELSELAERDQARKERHGLLTFYKHNGLYYTQIDEKLILVCTPDRLMQVADRAAEGPGAQVKKGELYGALAERVGLPSAHFAIVAEDPQGKGRALLDEHANKYGLGKFTEDAKRLGFGVEIAADYRLVAVAQTPDEERAQALETATRDKLGTVANNMFVRMLGLGGMVSRLRVSRDESYVFVRGTIPEVDFNAAIDRLHKMLSLSRGATAEASPLQRIE